MSNKKNKFIVITIFILLLVLLWQLKKENWTDSSAYDFAIEDTSVITKIFMADLKGNTITLERKDNKWCVNTTYKVRRDAIRIILKTISKISVQRPVSESSYNRVITDLATAGVKVEIYQNNEKKPIKIYTIGNNTSDHKGTYMLLKGEDQPYIMHIPGFNGILNPRYGLKGQEVDIHSWRDKSVFKLKSQDILSVTLIDKKEKYSSFTIKNNGNLSLYNYQNNKVESEKINLAVYLNNFKDLNCESYKNESIKEKLDSTKILYALFAKHKSGIDSLMIYRMKEEKKFIVDRMYGILNNGDVMMIQNYVFNKVLISIEELKEK